MEKSYRPILIIKKKPEKGEIIHHIDCNPKNESRDNLIIVNKRQHYFIHRAMYFSLEKHLKQTDVSSMVLCWNPPRAILFCPFGLRIYGIVFQHLSFYPASSGPWWRRPVQIEENQARPGPGVPERPISPRPKGFARLSPLWYAIPKMGIWGGWQGDGIMI